MTQWTRRILRRKDGKGTVTDTEDGNDVKATKLMEFIVAAKPTQAKKGLRITFMHDLDQGTIYWLEGRILQRVTKLHRAKRREYTENFIRVGNIRVINTWREDTKPLPVTVCINLTRDVGWTKVSAKALPVGEGSTIEAGPDDIPASKREEEVDKDDEDNASSYKRTPRQVRWKPGPRSHIKKGHRKQLSG